VLIVKHVVLTLGGSISQEKFAANDTLQQAARERRTEEILGEPFE